MCLSNPGIKRGELAVVITKEAVCVSVDVNVVSRDRPTRADAGSCGAVHCIGIVKQGDRAWAVRRKL